MFSKFISWKILFEFNTGLSDFFKTYLYEENLRILSNGVYNVYSLRRRFENEID